MEKFEDLRLYAVTGRRGGAKEDLRLLPPLVGRSSHLTIAGEE